MLKLAGWFSLNLKKTEVENVAIESFPANIVGLIHPYKPVDICIKVRKDERAKKEDSVHVLVWRGASEREEERKRDWIFCCVCKRERLEWLPFGLSASLIRFSVFTENFSFGFSF